MKINILHCLNGAFDAKGLTVIIDVFRAFSLEAYIMDKNPKELRPIGDYLLPLKYKEENKDIVIIGERHAIKLDGYDYGNSPSEIRTANLTDKIVYHTTSAGTQGIVNAINASEIITGSLVNAKAIANYIKNSGYEEVSLVAMGREGNIRSEEDELCASYIKALLEGSEFDLVESIKHLKDDGGKAFFDEKYKDILPKEDFYYCTDCNKFNFVLRVDKDNNGFIIKRIDME